MTSKDSQVQRQLDKILRLRRAHREAKAELARISKVGMGEFKKLEKLLAR